MKDDARCFVAAHQQTDSLIERSSGRSKESLQQTGFDSQADLPATSPNYLKRHNHLIHDASSTVKCPSGAQGMAEKRREFAIQRVYDQAGLDS